MRAYNILRVQSCVQTEGHCAIRDGTRAAGWEDGRPELTAWTSFKYYKIDQINFFKYYKYILNTSAQVLFIYS